MRSRCEISIFDNYVLLRYFLYGFEISLVKSRSTFEGTYDLRFKKNGVIEKKIDGEIKGAGSEKQGLLFRFSTFQVQAVFFRIPECLVSLERSVRGLSNVGALEGYRHGIQLKISRENPQS